MIACFEVGLSKNRLNNVGKHEYTQVHVEVEEYDVIPTLTYQPKTEDWCGQYSSKYVGTRRKAFASMCGNTTHIIPEVVKYDRANTFS